MATTNWANDGLLDLLGDGYNWPSSTVGAALFLKSTWVPAKGDTNLAAIILSGATEMAAASYVRQVVTGKLVTPAGGAHRSHRPCDQIDFGALEAAFDYNVLVVYLDGVNDAARTVLLTFDVDVNGDGSGANRTTDGNPVVFVPDLAALWDVLSA